MIYSWQTTKHKKIAGVLPVYCEKCYLMKPQNENNASLARNFQISVTLQLQIGFKWWDCVV